MKTTTIARAQLVTQSVGTRREIPEEIRKGFNRPDWEQFFRFTSLAEETARFYLYLSNFSSGRTGFVSLEQMLAILIERLLWEKSEDDLRRVADNLRPLFAEKRRPIKKEILIPMNEQTAARLINLAAFVSSPDVAPPVLVMPTEAADLMMLAFCRFHNLTETGNGRLSELVGVALQNHSSISFPLV